MQSRILDWILLLWRAYLRVKIFEYGLWISWWQCIIVNFLSFMFASKLCRRMSLFAAIIYTEVSGNDRASSQQLTLQRFREKVICTIFQHFCKSKIILQEKGRYSRDLGGRGGRDQHITTHCFIILVDACSLQSSEISDHKMHINTGETIILPECEMYR